MANNKSIDIFFFLLLLFFFFYWVPVADATVCTAAMFGLLY
jgi:hypothetical protein